MAINKVVYGNDTLIDLTEDSVGANNLLEGETAHDRSGNPVTGTAKQGHVVQDDSGTDMTQRGTIQFKGLNVTDDSTNGKTVVEATKTSVGLGNVPNVTTDDQIPTVTEAAERVNITAGDTLKTIIGKIKKFFTDLKAVAFSGSYSDLDDTPTIPSLDDVKTLKNYYDTRPTSADIEFSNGRLFHFKATSAMTTGKPSFDGSILHFGWDNNNGYNAQLAIHNSNHGLQFRSQIGHVWGEWLTVATTNDVEEITRPSRASVSVLTYATTLSEGIHFYTTTSGTTDNPPDTGSCMFIIFKASTGITVFGLPLASRGACINASYNSGSTWSGWVNIVDFVSKTNGGTFGGNIAVDRQDGTTSAVGSSGIILGNDIPSGTDKNSRGYAYIYGTSAYYARLRAGALTANRTIDLPNKSGTVALTSDIKVKSTDNTGVNKTVKIITTMGEQVFYIFAASATTSSPTASLRLVTYQRYGGGSIGNATLIGTASACTLSDGEIIIPHTAYEFITVISPYDFTLTVTS